MLSHLMQRRDGGKRIRDLRKRFACRRIESLFRFVRRDPAEHTVEMVDRSRDLARTIEFSAPGLSKRDTFERLGSKPVVFYCVCELKSILVVRVLGAFFG